MRGLYEPPRYGTVRPVVWEDGEVIPHLLPDEEKSNRYVKSTIPEKHKGYGIALGSYVHGATPAEYFEPTLHHF